MTRRLLALFALALAATQAPAQTTWESGKHYTVMPQPQRTNVGAGKVEVMEVFSYGCPACNQFLPVMRKLKASLPPNAQITYLPASWNQAEAWPMFQRAYLTAQSLGIAEKAHDEMFKAIWMPGGELTVLEADGRRLKKNLPTIEDAAKFYARVTGVKAADFVQASKSFSVDMKMRQADAQIITMRVSGTPTLVINGKYRINNEALPSTDAIVELTKFLVAKENAPTSPPAPTPTPAQAPAKKS
jgi:protein dithiol oxidoreductase (disulfide-forming)